MSRAKQIEAAFRRLTHDLVIIGRPGAKALPEIFEIGKVTDIQLSNLIMDAIRVSKERLKA